MILRHFHRPATKWSFLILSTFFVLISTVKVYGQSSDFRSWWNAEISAPIIKDLRLSVDLGQRFKYNSLQYDRSLLTTSLEYDLPAGFDVSAGYRYLLVRDVDRSLVSRYRINADLSYSMDVDQLSLSARQRVQYGFDDLTGIDDLYSNKLISRTRMGLDYHIFGTPFTPYANYELWVDLNRTYPVAHRYKLGFETKLSVKSSIELSYMFEKEVNTANPMKLNVLLVSYDYSF